MSSGGLGNWVVMNDGELSATLQKLREVCGWKGEIVFQEFIPGVKEVPSFQFYLQESGGSLLGRHNDWRILWVFLGKRSGGLVQTRDV